MTYTTDKVYTTEANIRRLLAELEDVKNELADYKYVQGEIAKRVCPGTTDSIDAVREIVWENVRMKRVVDVCMGMTHRSLELAEALSELKRLQTNAQDEQNCANVGGEK